MAMEKLSLSDTPTGNVKNDCKLIWPLYGDHHGRHPSERIGRNSEMRLTAGGEDSVATDNSTSKVAKEEIKNMEATPEDQDGGNAYEATTGSPSKKKRKPKKKVDPGPQNPEDQHELSGMAKASLWMVSASFGVMPTEFVPLILRRPRSWWLHPQCLLQRAACLGH